MNLSQRGKKFGGNRQKRIHPCNSSSKNRIIIPRDLVLSQQQVCEQEDLRKLALLRLSARGLLLGLRVLQLQNDNNITSHTKVIWYGSDPAVLYSKVNGFSILVVMRIHSIGFKVGVKSHLSVRRACMFHYHQWNPERYLSEHGRMKYGTGTIWYRLRRGTLRSHKIYRTYLLNCTFLSHHQSAKILAFCILVKYGERP